MESCIGHRVGNFMYLHFLEVSKVLCLWRAFLLMVLVMIIIIKRATVVTVSMLHSHMERKCKGFGVRSVFEFQLHH